MAFPTIQTADTTSGTQTTNATNWTLNYPANIGNGDLVLAMVAHDGTGNNPSISSWNGLGASRTSLAMAATNNGANGLFVQGLLADGTETGTFTAAIGANEQGAWRVFRITGWFGTWGATAANAFIGTSTTTGSPSQNPDPPSLNPNLWDVEDTLWIAAMSADTSRTVSAFPANCPDLQTADVSGGANGATLGIAMASSAVASFNPDAFTISASDDWVAATIAVRPAAFAEIRHPWLPSMDAVRHSNTW